MLTARTEVTDRMLISVDATSGRFSPRMPGTATDDPSQRPAPPLGPDEFVTDLSQERIKRWPVPRPHQREPASRIEVRVKASSRVLAPHR
jgi:hypothetical protein